MPIYRIEPCPLLSKRQTLYPLYHMTSTKYPIISHLNPFFLPFLIRKMDNFPKLEFLPSFPKWKNKQFCGAIFMVESSSKIIPLIHFLHHTFGIPLKLVCAKKAPKWLVLGSHKFWHLQKRPFGRSAAWLIYGRIRLCHDGSSWACH